MSLRRVAAVLVLGAVLAAGCSPDQRTSRVAAVPVKVLGASLTRVVPPTTTTTTTIPATTSTTADPTATGITITATADARVTSALAAIHVTWPLLLPGWTLSIQGPRAGYQGGTFPDQHRIEIYVRATSTVAQIAHVIAHELGHAVDVTYFDDATRATIQQMRGRTTDLAWWVAPGASDFSSGAGDWAETYAWVVTGGLGKWSSLVGGPPDAAEQAAITGLVAQRSGT